MRKERRSMSISLLMRYFLYFIPVGRAAPTKPQLFEDGNGNWTL
jgi:hypothetical protein